MADSGINFNSLIESLSGLGSASANLADLAITGVRSNVLPLTDYSRFSNHILFGDAVRKFRLAERKIRDTYPIGLSAGDIASLSAENVYKVDQWRKEATGFELYVLDELGATGTITASATNQDGDVVPLVHVRRDTTNTITGSQTATITSISSQAHSFEDEGVEFVKQTAGSTNDNAVYAVTAEVSVNRAQKLKTWIPEILFDGDKNDVLEKILQAFGDLTDDIKVFIDQLANIKRISYDDYDRVPDKFLPVLASDLGVVLYQAAVNAGVRDFLTVSTTGLSNQEITHDIWLRILNNLWYLLKNKGNREVLEAIGRIYGVDHNLLKVNEYSIFNSSIPITVREEIDTPTLFSTGDVYVQLPTSVSAFDYDEAQNFTLQFRVSATAGYNTIFRHPLYSLHLDVPNGQAIFEVTGGTSAFTTVASTSAMIARKNEFTNVTVSRSGDLINIWITGLSGSGSGDNDSVIVASGSTAGAQNLNYDSSGGFGAFGAYFPGSGSFSGYIHEVRAWNTFLHENDIIEHTRNYLSTSILNSTASPNSAGYGSLQAHYKLRENVVLTGSYNWIVDSTTSNLTATPVNFNNQTSKRYKVFSNQQILSNMYPTSLDRDNDKVRQADPKKAISDPGSIGFNFEPINVVNRDIRSVKENLNVKELLGDPEDLYRQKYTGPIFEALADVLTRYGTIDNTFDSGTGATASSFNIVDVNTFIDAVDNFSNVLGGVFTFAKQFIPAKAHLLSEGVLIEPHILERPKHAREDYTLTAFTPTAFNINTHFIESDSAAVTAATTATFQGFKLGTTSTVVNASITSNEAIFPMQIADSINVPRFYQTRVGRFSPIKVQPEDVDSTDIDVTVTRLIISPTASPSAHDGFIDGGVQLLSRGKPFRTDTPSLKFEFPASSDGTNYFIAEIGDIDNGRGRIVSGQDTQFTTNIKSNRVQVLLKLSDGIRALSGDLNSLSGSIGIVPINITNLFNNKTQILRIAISNDNSLVDQITNQGGVKLTT